MEQKSVISNTAAVGYCTTQRLGHGFPIHVALIPILTSPCTELQNSLLQTGNKNLRTMSSEETFQPSA
jgi:hypothetical protein